MGCFRGSVEAWERTADPLAKAGDVLNAIGWLEGARAHAEKLHAEGMASLGQLEERTKKILADAMKPDTPLPMLGSDGKPIDLGKLQKLLDAIELSRKVMEEGHRTLDARLLQSIEGLRAKATTGR